MFITLKTREWEKLMFNITFSKKKSNRDVLCLICWEILTYEQREDHLRCYPSTYQIPRQLESYLFKQKLEENVFL